MGAGVLQGGEGLHDLVELAAGARHRRPPTTGSRSRHGGRYTRSDGRAQGRKVYQIVIKVRAGPGVSGVMVPLGGQPGSEPDLAEGAWSLADDPAGDQGLEGLEDLGMEAVGARRYQGSEGGDKLSHGGGLRAAEVSGVVLQPQDTKTVRTARSAVVADAKVRKARLIRYHEGGGCSRGGVP